MIFASEETYDLSTNAFGRDSFDGAGAMMDPIFNRGYACPNASWNGIFISFCPGFTTDDVTAHEWGHAYTAVHARPDLRLAAGRAERGLLGHLGRDGRPHQRPRHRHSGGARTVGSCSAFTPLAAAVARVNSPPADRGRSSPAQSAQFGAGAHRCRRHRQRRASARCRAMRLRPVNRTAARRSPTPAALAGQHRAPRPRHLRIRGQGARTRRTPAPWR